MRLFLLTTLISIVSVSNSAPRSAFWSIELYDLPDYDGRRLTVPGWGRPLRAEFGRCFEDAVSSIRWHEGTAAGCVCLHDNADGKGKTRCVLAPVADLAGSGLNNKIEAITIYAKDDENCVYGAHAAEVPARRAFRMC